MTPREARDVMLLVRYLDRDWLPDAPRFALARLRADAEQVAEDAPVAERRPLARVTGWAELVTHNRG